MEHDYLEPAKVQSTYGQSSTTMSVSRAIGFDQFLSGGNYIGKFVRGTYRCNGVSIYKIMASSSDVIIPEQVIAGSKFNATGALAAYLAAQSLHYDLGLERVWSTTRQQEAVNKAYAKVLKPDLDVGVMLGEMRETLEGLRNPLKGLRKYLSDYRRLKSLGALKRSKDAASAFSDTWLEWRFGIRPLLKSITDVIEYVNSQNREFDGKMQKRRGKTAVKQTVRKVSLLQGGGFFSEIKGEATISTESWTSAKVAFTLSSPLSKGELLGTDIFSAPGVAWELVPLSFIVDRFVAIGTWLEALKVYTSSATIHGVAVTQRDDTTYTTALSSVKVGSQAVRFSNGGSYSVVCQSMQRRCLSPGFNTVTPALNSRRQDLQQILDDLTLIYQRL